MEANFGVDKPISEEKDDKFQRYPFSKRIADSIINRSSSDNIVIGIYGAWGEGKTSVLNFIEKELENKDKLIAIKFNPWRYNDEITLLKQFFQALATALNAKLKSKKEEAGELLRKYGKLLSIEIPFVGNLGEKIEKTGELIAEVDIDTMKKRIGEILVENEKKVVIFIDDLDRLEKDEIHAVFRLVKLTGDFANTTYILSFDENIVSAAIGERFGTGDQNAGFNFLEKIIQIPLKIPLAQKGALMKYCFDLIERSIKESGIVLSDQEYENFSIKFISHILVRLNTPRLAVRYANSLSFSLPLLKGEVNYVDLFLIEAIKVFFPELYLLIRNQAYYFIGSYKNLYRNELNLQKINEFKDIIKNKCINYNPEENRKINEILTELFPNLGYVWYPNWDIDPLKENIRYNEKRISSSYYFNRYFSYTVIEGDISDVAFDELLEFIKDGDFLDKIEKTVELLKNTSP